MLLFPDSKVHGANMGPTWVRQDPGVSHAGPINFAIRVGTVKTHGGSTFELNIHSILGPRHRIVCYIVFW